AVLHRHQLDRTVEDRLNLLGAAPEIRNSFRGREQLLHLVMSDIRRRRPERKHVVSGDVVVERFERGLMIGKAVNVHANLLSHSGTSETLTPRKRTCQPIMTNRMVAT